MTLRFFEPQNIRLTQGNFAKVRKLWLFCVGFYALPLTAVSLGCAARRALFGVMLALTTVSIGSAARGALFGFMLYVWLLSALAVLRGALFGFYAFPLTAVGIGFAKAQAFVLYFFSPEKKYQKAGIRRSPL